MTHEAVIPLFPLGKTGIIGAPDTPQWRYVKAARVAVGLTQKALADRAKVAVTTVQNWESGERWPIKANRRAILDVLSAEGVDFLYDGQSVHGVCWPKDRAP
jgi:DNA-binding transcriptional regulator YiaG